MKLITIFTPTYNRAYTLHKLYGSLKRQTDKDFVWLIVDDGSSDGTKEVVSRWKYENVIPIKYIFQENAGKMQAHNLGAVMAESELFLCVDSDDYLEDDAISSIRAAWNGKSREVCGIIAQKRFIKNGSSESVINKFPIKGLTSLHNLYKCGFKGDTALVFRTEIIRQYPFPRIEGERFITEAVSYDLIDLKYVYLLLEKPLIVCEYMEDGYTANAAKTKLQYPNGWALFFNQRARYYSPTLRLKLYHVMYYIIFSRMGKARNIYTSSSVKGITYAMAWLLSKVKEKTYINSLRAKVQ